MTGGTSTRARVRGLDVPLDRSARLPQAEPGRVAIKSVFLVLAKVDGNKLTGETTSSMPGKSTISDGKVDGDTVTFTITANLQGNELKLNYKGTIKGP